MATVEWAPETRNRREGPPGPGNQQPRRHHRKATFQPRGQQRKAPGRAIAMEQRSQGPPGTIRPAWTNWGTKTPVCLRTTTPPNRGLAHPWKTRPPQTATPDSRPQWAGNHPDAQGEAPQNPRPAHPQEQQGAAGMGEHPRQGAAQSSQMTSLEPRPDSGQPFTQIQRHPATLSQAPRGPAAAGLMDWPAPSPSPHPRHSTDPEPDDQFVLLVPLPQETVV